MMRLSGGTCWSLPGDRCNAAQTVQDILYDPRAEAMTFTFPCGDCGKTYEVEDKHVGRRFRCECGATCTVIAPKGKASGALKETAAEDERPRKKSVTASDASEDKQSKSQAAKAAPPRKKAPVKKSSTEEFDDVEVVAPSRKKRRVQEVDEYGDIEDYDDYEVLDDDDDGYDSYRPKRRSGSRSKAKGKKVASSFSFGKVMAYFPAGLSANFIIWMLPFLIGLTPVLAVYFLWNNRSPGDGVMIHTVLRAMSFVGAIAIAVGGLSGLIGAAKEDPICAVLWVLVPFYSLYYLVTRLDEQKFAVGCIAWGLLTFVCQSVGWQLVKTALRSALI